MDDYAVIGSGIGGSATALLLSKKYDVTLYEKEPYLGGCSSTYKRGKYYYNSGATTFAGYEKGTFLYEFFENNNIKFKKTLLDNSLCVIINEKKIKRYRDFELFIDEINKVFFHYKNYEFYKLIIKINKIFFSINDYYYSNKDTLSKVKSLYSFRTLLKALYPYLFVKADKFIKNFFGTISKEYLNYIDNQVLIVSQARTPEINFLTCALALGYQFMDNYYIYGGLGSVFEAMESKIKNIKKEQFIKKIEKQENYYNIHTLNNSFKAKNIVLNSSLFDSKELFSDEKILSYINSYKKFDLGVSAFMVYMKINTAKDLQHHYQIILPKVLKYCISNSLFVSLGSKDDEKMNGSITISIHTNMSFWKDNIKEKKKELVDIIKNIVCEKLDINKSEIIKCFGATPHTFKKFINRSSLGGIAVKFENFVFKLPSNDTPIKGLYNVGDTTFAAQGWPGVMLGVRNLQRLLCST